MARARQGQHRYTGWGAPPAAKPSFPWRRLLGSLTLLAVLGAGVYVWRFPEVAEPLLSKVRDAKPNTVANGGQPMVYRWETNTKVVTYSYEKPPDGVAYRQVPLPPDVNVVPRDNFQPK